MRFPVSFYMEVVHFSSSSYSPKTCTLDPFDNSTCEHASDWNVSSVPLISKRLQTLH